MPLPHYTKHSDKVPTEDDFLEEELILFLRGHPAGTKKQDPKGRDLGKAFTEALSARLQAAMALPMTYKLDSGLTLEISRVRQ